MSYFIFVLLSVLFVLTHENVSALSAVNKFQIPSSYTSFASLPTNVYSSVVLSTTTSSNNYYWVPLNLANSYPFAFPLLLPVVLNNLVGTGSSSVNKVQVIVGCGDASCTPSLAQSSFYLCVDTTTCSAEATQNLFVLNINPSSVSGPVVRNGYQVTDTSNNVVTYLLDVTNPLGPLVNSLTSSLTGSSLWLAPWNVAANSGFLSSKVLTYSYGVNVSSTSVSSLKVPLNGPFTRGAAVNAASSAVLKLNCGSSSCSSSTSSVYLCVDAASCSTVGLYNFFVIPLTSASVGSVSYHSLTLTGVNGWNSVYQFTVTVTA